MMTTKRLFGLERAAALGAELGEGPVWIATAQALWSVDIKRLKIFCFHPVSGELATWDAPAQPGWVLPSVEGGMIAGLQTGVHRFDPGKATFDLIHAPEAALPTNRLNDASTDPCGRLWFGSMDDGERAANGRLYCLADGRCADSGLPPVPITNGPAVAPDGRTLYPVDTLGKVIWKVPVNEAGQLGSPELFARIEDGAGHPDGAVCDAEGCLWLGLFGGWAVRRYDPAGRLMLEVPFPVAQVTKLAFGGPDLSIAYATTARKGLDAAALADQPQAGDLFAFEPGVRGLPVTPVQL